MTTQDTFLPNYTSKRYIGFVHYFIIAAIVFFPSLSFTQNFEESFIQYYRSVEVNKISVTESQLSWVNPINGDTIYWDKDNLVIDEMPRFQGCEEIKDDAIERKKCADTKLLEYIYGNLVYPIEALEERIEGTAIVNFYVNPDGTLSNAFVRKDEGAYTAGAALDLLEKMNDEITWISGKSKGKKAPVLFSLPIRFKLGPENRIQHPKMYSKYYETNNDWELIYDPEGEASLNEKAEVRMLIGDDGKVLNTRIYSPLSKAAHSKIHEIIMDLLNHSKWKPGSTYSFENTMEYVFTIKL